MKLYYDLHIHTALSPCGQEWMSPNNILNMASLKELDFIAICDHNSVKQLINFDLLQSSYELIVIPGVEMTVSEGYHVVCLFPSFINAYEFGNEIIKNLNPIDHDLTKLGHQVVFDYNDEYAHEIMNVTHQQLTKVTVHKLREYIDRYNGVMILGHIERYDKKIYNEVQTIYKDCFDAIEINARSDYDKIIKENPFLLNYTITRSSDAHDLEIISEKEHFFDLEEKSIDALFRVLKR